MAFVAFVAFAAFAAFAAERTLNIAATVFPSYSGKDPENNGLLSEISREAVARGPR